MSRNASLPKNKCVQRERKAGAGFLFGGKLGPEASRQTAREVYERMARRRFQKPDPFIRGVSWILSYWDDVFEGGQIKRKKVWKNLCPSTTPFREVQKIADELLRPLNQGLQTIGSATLFRTMTDTYIEADLPALATTTRSRYREVIRNFLIPAFGNQPLRELTPLLLQRYFSGLGRFNLSRASHEKIRVVLSAVLTAAVKYGYLVTNPTEGIRLLPDKKGKRVKPHLTPEQFHALTTAMEEPYSTMVVVAAYTGLRVSELLALRWEDVGFDSIRVDERFCRGDWSQPKTKASAATIDVDRQVIERIHRLKLLTVEVKAGLATRRFKAVKSAEPGDLVFQAVQEGGVMNDQNVLARHLKPAARRAGIPSELVSWRSLRTSRATWMVEAGANVKDVQSLMRHSKIQTTLDIYAQFVPDGQRRANEQTSRMIEERIQAVRQQTGLASPDQLEANGSRSIQ